MADDVNRLAAASRASRSLEEAARHLHAAFTTLMDAGVKAGVATRELAEALRLLGRADGRLRAWRLPRGMRKHRRRELANQQRIEFDKGGQSGQV